MFGLLLGISPAPVNAMVDQEPDPIMIGVLDLEANGVDAGEAKAISDRLRFYLGMTGKFQPIERNQMDDIMEEMGFQLSGACDTDECVVQVGQMLGASKMVAGSVSKVGNLYSLQIRLIDIESSTIEEQAFSDVTGVEDVLTVATEDVANQLAGQGAGQTGGRPGAVSGSGSMQFTSDPVGAEISIDGASSGVTPLTLQNTPGSYQIIISREGFASHTQTVQVIAGGIVPVHAVLAEVPSGTVTVTSTPPGAVVTIDGRERGPSPLSEFRLEVGDHLVEVSLPGYDPVSQTVTITRRRNSVMTAELLMSGEANLSIESNYTGARIYIDGVLQNRQTPTDVFTLRPGSHTIRVVSPGYTTWEETVDLQVGSQEKLVATLRQKSRFGAGVLGLLVPGMGHFTSGRKGMGALVLLGTVASAGFAASQITTFRDIRSEYDDLYARYLGSPNTDVAAGYHRDLDVKHAELLDAQSSAKTAVMIAGGLHTLGVLHSVFFMPRLRAHSTGVPAMDLDIGSRAGTASITLRIRF